MRSRWRHSRNSQMKLISFLKSLLICCAAIVLVQFAAVQTLSAQAKKSSTGRIENDVYQNSTLGFSCRIPFGWVDRTQAMQTPDSGSTSQVLLAVFERPPEATGETINSGIVIASENASSYPKVKTALEYFEPFTEAATSHGFTAVSEPRPFAIGAAQLVRGDFSKPRGELTMYQSSLVMIRKGSIISFTFIGGDSDEVEELIRNLEITAVSTPRHPKSVPAHK
ncbi:MAG TPA: hypothetical protein VGG46_07435 [Terriglobales bacterium]